MSTIHILLCVICLVITLGFGMPQRNLLKHQQRFATLADWKRAALLRTAAKEVGVRELTGNNDGVRIKIYLAAVDIKSNAPWCAAFVSWVYQVNGYTQPHSAWSPDLFPRARLTAKPLPGDVMGIYFPALKRIAHVGLIIGQKNDWIISIEGNTNISGSRNGDGVYRKMRHIRTIYRTANWLKERRKIP